MGYGIKLKKPAYTKSTDLYRLNRIPEVLIPVGDDYTITVSKGDSVLIGQLLGVPLTAQTPLHCSVSGTVSDIVNIEGTDHIKIQNDHKYTLSSDIGPCTKRLSQMTSDEMIERIRLCGIPDWSLLAKLKGKAKRLAIDCLDQDPYSSDKKCAIRNYPKELMGGAKIVLKILGLSECEFVIEKTATDAINDLIDYIGDSALFDIVETEGKYPLGERERLISQLPASDELDPTQLCIIDVHSLCAVYRAFAGGIPYIRRIVSIGGSAALRGGCYELPLGTPFKYITEHLTDPESTEEFEIIKNGVMTGELSASAESVTDPSVFSLSYIYSRELTVRPGECIGCTKCDRACPDKLLPSLFVERLEGDFDEALSISGMNYCSGCGACTYVCPAKLPITELAHGSTEVLKPNQRHKKTTLTSAPFIRHPESTRSINSDFILALFALLAWAVCRFGIRSLAICGISVGVAVVSDILFSLLTKNGIRSVLDLSSVVCGMMCALTLWVNVPLYVPAITAFFAVMVIKGVFGGNGKNIIHSAFTARILASLLWHDSFVYDPQKSYTLFDHLLGNTEGAMGEVSVIILAACGLYLAIRRAISIVPTLVSLSTFALVAFLVAPADNAPDTVKLMLIGSAVIFVSIFSCAEYSSQPKNILGKVAYGVLFGIFAALIGRFTSFEGAYFACVAASAVTTTIFNKLRQADSYGDPSDEIEEYGPTDDEEYESDDAYKQEDIFADTDSDSGYLDDNISEQMIGSDSALINRQPLSDTQLSVNVSSIRPATVEQSTEMFTAPTILPEDKSDTTDAADDSETEQNNEHETNNEPSPGQPSAPSETEEFKIESAEELFGQIYAELGLESNKSQAAEPPPEKKAESDDSSTHPALDSTALFDKLFDEMDLDDDPDDILNIKK